MSEKKKLVVIGNGMAGARTVEEILQRGGATQYDITVIGDEPHGNYNRILLSNVLSGAQSPSEIYLNPLTWYRENNITLHAPMRAARIDRAAKVVFASAVGGRADAEPMSLTYDTLIIATGSRPYVPQMEGLSTSDGADKPGVCVFRTLDDCHKIAGCANKCERAVVIGGGLLGLEAARGLLKYGVEVHVVHIGASLMSAQLDAQAAALLKAQIERMGIHVHLNKSTTAVLGEDCVTGLAFADGTSLACDMVVISAGIRPNAEIAKECGLAVERAIVVDDQMRSVTDPDIYVVGECAQHRGVTYGLVAPLWEQGQVLADHVTGRKPTAAYKGSKLVTKLKVMGIQLVSMGVTQPMHDTDEVVLFMESRKGIYQKLIIRDDTLIGAIMLGDTEKASALIQAFDHASPLSELRRELLFDSAPPAGASSKNKLLEMPDAVKVCNCIGVTKRDIRKCVEGGCRTLESVQAATRAGSGCGTCKPLVKDIVEWVADGGETPPPTQPSSEMPALLAELPFAKPEVAGAIKVLMRELMDWASKD
jgi:nitrite reductase (NADH) large subunit